MSPCRFSIYGGIHSINTAGYTGDKTVKKTDPPLPSRKQYDSSDTGSKALNKTVMDMEE